MNRVYKVIWSKTKHCYVVTSEIAKSHTKGESTGRGLKKLAAALLVAAALMGPNFAWAADGMATVKDTTNVEQKVYTQEGADGKFATKTDLADYYVKKVEAEVTNLTAAGDVKAGGALNAASGNFKVDGVTGDVKTVNLTTTGSAVIGDALTVEGDTEMKGDLGVKGNLSVEGVFAGGDTADAAKASLNADGSIKGADGQFAVGTDGSIKGANGKFEVDANGKVTANGGVDTNGGEILTHNGAINAGSGDIAGKDISASGDITGKDISASGDLHADGDIHGKDITGSGTLTGQALTDGTARMEGGVLTGVTTITATGNISTGGDVVSTGGKVQGTSVSDGTATLSGGSLTGAVNIAASGTITGNNVVVKDNLTTKNLEVTDGLKTDHITLGSEPLNYTDIKEGNVTSKVQETSGGVEYTAESVFNKYGSSITARTAEGVVDSTGISKVGAKEISQYLGNNAEPKSSDKNVTRKMVRNDNGTFRMEDKVVDGAKSSTVNQTETGIKSTATDGKNTASTNLSNGGFNTYATDGTNKTYTKQTAVDIKNTAEKGMISNTAKNLVNSASENMTNNVGKNLETTVGGEMKTTVTGKATEDYKSDLDTKVGGNENHYVKGNQTNTVSGDRTVSVKGTETENFNAQVTNIKTNQKTSVGGNQTNIVVGNQQNTVSGSKTETVKGSVTEKYGSQATTLDGDQSTNVGGSQSNVVAGDQTNTISGSKTETVKVSVTEKYGSQATTLDGDQSTNVGGSQSNVVAGDQTNTISGSKTETVKGAVTETYGSQTTKVNGDQSTTVTGKQTNSITGDQVNTIGGNQTTTVTGDSSLSAKNITNTAEGGTIYNKSNDILNEASGDILNFADGEIGNVATKITNITGDNTVTSNTDGTTFENTGANTPVEDGNEQGSRTNTKIKGNTVETGKVMTDFADVNNNLTVGGSTTLGRDGGNTNLTVNSKSEFRDTVKMEKTLEVDGESTFNNKVTITKGGLDVKGGTTTDTLTVTGDSEFVGRADFRDKVFMNKDLEVTGETRTGTLYVNNDGYVDGNLYVNKDGYVGGNLNVEGNIETHDAVLSADSRQVVTGRQLYQTNERVDKLDNRIKKVGANAAALAALRPGDFNPDDKFSIAAGFGSYRNASAAALGLFYRPNENVILSLGTSFGDGENMVNAGVSVKFGRGKSMAERRKEMAEEVSVMRDEMKNQNDRIAELEEMLKKQSELIEKLSKES